MKMGCRSEIQRNMDKILFTGHVPIKFDEGQIKGAQVDFPFLKYQNYYAPAPNRRGIKRCFCLSVCLSDVLSVCRVHRA